MFALIKGLLRILPTDIASALIIRIVRARRDYKLKEDEKSWVDSAEKFEYAEGRFAYKIGTGPVVVLVHGWGGAAGQWYKMAGEIADLGYTVIAPDISSHGQSEGKYIAFRNFWNDLKELSDFIEEDIYAYVGHSAGALGLMTGRKLKGLAANRYVCIAAPSHPYPPIKTVTRIFNPSERVLDRLRGYYAKQFGSSWDRITENSFSADSGSDLLLVYDENDRILVPGDVETIRRYNPSAEHLVTNDAGHDQLLRSDRCIERVCEFLNKESQAA